MELNTLLKTGLLTSTLTLSICQADKIRLASFAEWTAANSDGKIAYLNNALNQMNEKDTGKKHYRLVITEDVPDGRFLRGTKGEVYLSDTSGETTTSYYSAYFTSNTAYHHNLSTHKALLELYKAVLQNKKVEEQAINDSLDAFLPSVYKDVHSSLQTLLGKDILKEQLRVMLEHISKPNVLCIQVKPVEISVPVETVIEIPEPTTLNIQEPPVSQEDVGKNNVEMPVTEASEPNTLNIQEPSVPQEKVGKIKKPVIRGSKVMQLVEAGNARDENAKKEAEILQNGKK